MELFFLRHGDAEISLFKTPRADFERNLTEYGQVEILKEAMAMKMFIEDFDVIFTSPLYRAVQTASIFAKVFRCDDRLKITNSLEPPASLEDLLEAVALEGEVERVLCVGHAPSLGLMATELVTGMVEERLFPLKKGGLLCIQLESPDQSAEAELLYLLDPIFLSRMGELVMEMENEGINPYEDGYEEDYEESPPREAEETMEGNKVKKYGSPYGDNSNPPPSGRLQIEA